MQRVSKLTEATIRNACPRDKPYRLSDGRGLTLLVNPDGSKWWRFRYRFGLKTTLAKGKNQEKEKSLSFGVFPEVRLAEARTRCAEARALLRRRIDPGAERKLEKLSSGDTLRVLAAELFKALERASPGKGVQPLSFDTIDKNRRRLEMYVFPSLGDRPIGLITVPELFAVLKKVQDKGNYETCKRLRHWCHKIWRYAVVTGRAPTNILLQMRGAFIPVRSENHPAITSPQRVGQLLRAIDGYTGQRITVLALKLAPYVFCRHTELRAAEWTEFNLTQGRWRLPGQRMKMKDPHEIPLCPQALAILNELQGLTGHGRFCFPNANNRNRSMSENTLSSALRALGFEGEEMTVQGFRTLASTLLNEAGIDPALIELQLAHLERNKSRRAYNHAKRMVARRKLMHLWGDLLDSLRNGIIPTLLANDDNAAPLTAATNSTPVDTTGLMAPDPFLSQRADLDRSHSKQSPALPDG